MIKQIEICQEEYLDLIKFLLHHDYTIFSCYQLLKIILSEKTVVLFQKKHFASLNLISTF